MKIFSNLVAGKVALFDSTIEGFFSMFLARLSDKTAGITLLIICFAFFEFLFPKLSFAFSASSGVNFNLASPLSPTTHSLFSEKIFYTTNSLNFSSKTVISSDLKPGEEKVLVQGKTGKKVIQTKIVYHNKQEYSRQEIIIENTTPVEQVTALGLNPSETFIDTPFGKLSYSLELRLWGTSYDSHCLGCGTRTSLGLPTGYGVVAVDPKVIPLGSPLYIPGYGLATAGDTGGAIKGNKIDLGFNDTSTSGWFAHFTDVYILN